MCDFDVKILKNQGETSQLLAIIDRAHYSNNDHRNWSNTYCSQISLMGNLGIADLYGNLYILVYIRENKLTTGDKPILFSI